MVDDRLLGQSSFAGLTESGSSLWRQQVAEPPQHASPSTQQAFWLSTDKRRGWGGREWRGRGRRGEREGGRSGGGADM